MAQVNQSIWDGLSEWEPGEAKEISIARIKALQARQNKPGFNEYGIPLHACYGYRHDGHYWEYVKHINHQKNDPQAQQ